MMSDALRKWLDGDDTVEETVRLLAETETWPAMPLDRATTRRLITLAHDALSRDPNRAVWISRLAMRAADTPIEEGDAWREYAAALLELREYENAREAVGASTTKRCSGRWRASSCTSSGTRSRRCRSSSRTPARCCGSTTRRHTSAR